MKKLLIIGTVIVSTFSFSKTVSSEQKTNQKQKSEITNTDLQNKIALAQTMRKVSSNNK